MRDADRKPFAVVIQGLAAAFRVEASTALQMAYWVGLEDLDLEDVQRAALAGLKSCEFFPTVAKLRQLAKKPHPNLLKGGSFVQGVGWIMPFVDEEEAERKHQRLRSVPRPTSDPSPIGEIMADPRNSWPIKAAGGNS
jgi:hypothetical protein